MAQIPYLLTAARTPKVGEKVLTPTDNVATIQRVKDGFAHSDPLHGPASQIPLNALKWFPQLDLWCFSKEQS